MVTIEFVDARNIVGSYIAAGYAPQTALYRNLEVSAFSSGIHVERFGRGEFPADVVQVLHEIGRDLPGYCPDLDTPFLYALVNEHEINFRDEFLRRQNMTFPEHTPQQTVVRDDGRLIFALNEDVEEEVNKLYTATGVTPGQIALLWEEAGMQSNMLQYRKLVGSRLKYKRSGEPDFEHFTTFYDLITEAVTAVVSEIGTGEYPQAKSVKPKSI